MQDLIEVDSRRPLVRIALLTVMITMILSGWFTVRWQLGDMLADLTSSSDPNAGDIADVALNWSPDDPAAVALKASAAHDASAAVDLYEETVRLAPYDYRWRIELGRAYEQDGRTDRAESEFTKAIDLAPNYGSSRWNLGNFYLRRERIVEAVDELKKAAENNSTYRDQVFSLAWDYFDKEAAEIEELAGEDPDSIAYLAYFFAAHGRAEDALRNWNRLGDKDKSDHRVLLRGMAIGLYDQRHFPEALALARQYGVDDDARPETVTNASFEKNIDDEQDARFGWHVMRVDPRFEAMTDGKVNHQGSRSLRVVFKGFNKPTLANIYQTIVVKPSQRYRLTFWVRTENLKSAGDPVLEVLNANDDNLITRSNAFSSGTNEWQEMIVQFATPENCDGINIRTGRIYCGGDCPISGIFWYDDFEIGKQ